MTVVLDASVAIAWFLEQEHSASARRAAEAILRGSVSAVVPELFFYEVLAVLGRKHPDFGSWCNTGLTWLMDAPIARVAMSADIGRAMQPLVDSGLTGYDAAYAAVAKMTGARWLTFDTRARRTLGNPKWIIHELT